MILQPYQCRSHGGDRPPHVPPQWLFFDTNPKGMVSLFGQFPLPECRSCDREKSKNIQ